MCFFFHKFKLLLPPKSVFFPILLYRKPHFLDFYEGACHYDVTEAKRWACCWYLFWYQCLEETLKLTIEHHRGFILKISGSGNHLPLR